MKSFMKFVFVLTTAVAVSVFSLPSVSASEQAEAVQSQDQTAAVQNASSKEQVKKVKQKKTKKSKKKGGSGKTGQYGKSRYVSERTGSTR